MTPHASLVQILVISGGLVIVLAALVSVILEELRQAERDPWENAPFRNRKERKDA